MRKLVISDLHFGIKSNSITWLESQLEFFDKQIFDAIENKNIDKVVFLGDVHDIRYSINQQIGIEIRNLFRKMLDKFPNKEFIILAGNHDYYTPLEEYSYYNFYELVFGEEFCKCHPNLRIINNDPWMDVDGSLYLPWYWTENTDHFDEILYNYDFSRDVKAVYCHADLTCWPGARIGSLRGCPVYSGHIHYIVDDPIGNLHNLGAALALTYNDVNQARYIYIIEDEEIKEKIENNTTPKFKRIFNDEMFEKTEEFFRNAYVEICISNKLYSKAKYIEQLKFLKNTYIDSNIRVHIIDDDTDITTLSVAGFNTNIESYIEDNIPEHLDDKFTRIKNKMKEA